VKIDADPFAIYEILETPILDVTEYLLVSFSLPDKSLGRIWVGPEDRDLPTLFPDLPFFSTRELKGVCSVGKEAFYDMYYIKLVFDGGTATGTRDYKEKPH